MMDLCQWMSILEISKYDQARHHGSPFKYRPVQDRLQRFKFQILNELTLVHTSYRSVAVTHQFVVCTPFINTKKCAVLLLRNLAC